MRYVRLAVFIGSLAWVPSSHAVGSVEEDTTANPISQVCYGLDGRRIETRRSDTLNDLAHAVLLKNIPYIVLNYPRLRKLPAKLQAFYFEHECSHHLLGHLKNWTISSETEADCLAIKLGRDKGLYSRDDIATFRRWIRPLQGSMQGHLPGWRRYAHMIRCFEDDGPRSPNITPGMRAAMNAVARFRKASRDKTTE